MLPWCTVCYAMEKKAKRNGWPCLCRSMVCSVVLISHHLTLGGSRGWLASLWVFLGGVFCCGALCACVCWFLCPKSFSQYPRKKPKISEQLFSEVAKTTSVEVKNSSQSVGDANSSPSGGKKQQIEEQKAFQKASKDQIQM